MQRIPLQDTRVGSRRRRANTDGTCTLPGAPLLPRSRNSDKYLALIRQHKKTILDIRHSTFDIGQEAATANAEELAT